MQNANEPLVDSSKDKLEKKLPPLPTKAIFHCLFCYVKSNLLPFFNYEKVDEPELKYSTHYLCVKCLKNLDPMTLNHRLD